MNTEVGQRRDGFFHRKTDNVRVRPGHVPDDELSVFLRRVGSGFVQNIDFGKVGADRGVVELPKRDR